MGIRIAFRTTPGGYRPLHWHEELESLYALNGNADITIEGKVHPHPWKQFIVINPREVHSTFAHSLTHMFLCIHISEKVLKRYIPDFELYRIQCCPGEADTDRASVYLDICGKLAEMTRLYIEEPSAAAAESEGLTLQILAKLIRHFSEKTAPAELSRAGQLTRERLLTVIRYVEEHYREPISTRDAAEELGLGVEYFCRFFRENMGTSFLRYLNEVRVTRICRELLQSDDPVPDIAERNGFTNQKLFNRTFREVYGTTPSGLRKSKRQ